MSRKGRLILDDGVGQGVGVAGLAGKMTGKHFTDGGHGVENRIGVLLVL